MSGWKRNLQLTKHRASNAPRRSPSFPNTTLVLKGIFIFGCLKAQETSAGRNTWVLQDEPEICVQYMIKNRKQYITFKFYVFLFLSDLFKFEASLIKLNLKKNVFFLIAVMKLYTRNWRKYKNGLFYTKKNPQRLEKIKGPSKTFFFINYILFCIIFYRLDMMFF